MPDAAANLLAAFGSLERGECELFPPRAHTLSISLDM
jgi:hypothetical protein